MTEKKKTNKLQLKDLENLTLETASKLYNDCKWIFVVDNGKLHYITFEKDRLKKIS